MMQTFKPIGIEVLITIGKPPVIWAFVYNKSSGNYVGAEA